jgi:hypothetical protein
VTHMQCEQYKNKIILTNEQLDIYMYND